MNYILDSDHNVILCKDVKDWAKWFEGADRKVVLTEREGYIISTVFLGADYGTLRESGPPVVFETMVFPDKDYPNDIYCDRYSTWDEAIEGHIKACDRYLSSYTRDDLFLDKV